jgi:hypothetical protein
MLCTPHRSSLLSFDSNDVVLIPSPVLCCSSSSPHPFVHPHPAPHAFGCYALLGKINVNSFLLLLLQHHEITVSKLSQPKISNCVT